MLHNGVLYIYTWVHTYIYKKVSQIVGYSLEYKGTPLNPPIAASASLGGVISHYCSTRSLQVLVSWLPLIVGPSNSSLKIRVTSSVWLSSCSSQGGRCGSSASIGPRQQWVVLGRGRVAWSSQLRKARGNWHIVGTTRTARPRGVACGSVTSMSPMVALGLRP
jgi:hypothetical protein